MVKDLSRWVLEFYRREDGPTSVEYAINLALIGLFCISTIQSLGQNANKTFNTVSSKLGSASS
jgi:Flp pilus assembly pilin Flp